MKKSIFIFFLFCFNLSIIGQSVSVKQLDNINNELWNRFIKKWGVIDDFTDKYGNISWPTTEDIKLGKPNALGWWTPIENGSMFGGIYMDGLIKRWQHTKSPNDSIKIKKLAEGLMLLANVSSIEGFFARGVSSDGISHYPMSSDDQAGGWLFGMWRYLQTTLPSDAERLSIRNKFINTSKVFVKLKWVLPAEIPFKHHTSLALFDHRAASLLFICKACFLLTNDIYWDSLYKYSLFELGGSSNLSRLETLKKGFLPGFKNYTTWHEAPAEGCLRLLWELETDSLLKEAYRKGLEINANNAMISILQYSRKMNYNDTSLYYSDWRFLNTLWRPQNYDTISENVGYAQWKLLDKAIPRWGNEAKFVREPCFAAWYVSLAPDKLIFRHRAADLQQLVDYYNVKNLCQVWFFPLEAVGWSLQDL